MRLFSVCGVQVRISLLTPLLFLFCALTGSLSQLMLAIVSLMLHEAAHTVMSRALDYRIREIELLPLGFTARLDSRTYNVWDELIIAAAGPMMSLLIALSLSQFAHAVEKPELLYELMGINIGIAAVNLIPAAPLDGGRALRSILMMFLSRRNADIISLALSLASGVLLLAAGIFILHNGSANVTAVMFGLFIIAGGAAEYRRREGAELTASADRRESVLRGNALPVRYIVLSADTRLCDAMKYFRSQKYTVVLAASEDMRICAQLTETDAVDRIAKYGADAPLYISGLN